MANEPVISDVELSSSLSQLAKSTTAAELVREAGQTKKLKVLSERKLLDWIRAELMRSLASRADSYSDQEKEQLLQATKASLEERILKEKNAERERERVQAELDRVMAQISSNTGDNAQLEQALATLRAQLAEAQDARTDLEQETYELHDELQAKLAMLSTTIAEKDKLRDTVRNQMLRSNGLVEGVLGLDATYYASRHQEENPILEDASDDERFYHDFDIGAAVITTLSQDLEQLRTITGTLGDGHGDQRSLEQDLALLSQVKAGNLHAMDVAAPIGGLVEALAGARAEAEALDEEVASATGGHPHPISDLPDAEGEPREVLAGATTVVRELAAGLARDRQRVAALRNFSEEADAARNATEEEFERLRHSHATLQGVVAERSTGDQALPDSELALLRSQLTQAQADAQRNEALLRAKHEELTQAVVNLRQQLAEATNTQHRALARAVVEAAQGDDRLADIAADLALGLDPESAPEIGYADQVVAAVESLAHRKLSIERELAQAQAAIASLQSFTVANAQAIAETRIESTRFQRQATGLAEAELAAREEAATAEARVEHVRGELDAALADLRAAQAETESARAEAVAAQTKIRELQSRHANRIRSDKALAGELLAVTRHDDLLADVGTDLSVALDDVAEEQLHEQLQKTVNALTQRQQSLHSENARLGRDSEHLRGELDEMRKNLVEIQRSVLVQVLQATRGDGDLTDSTRQLEWALERLRPGEPLPGDLQRILDDSLTRLAQRKQELQTERDEVALSGKEIISALTTTRDQRELELNELRRANAEAADRLTMLESRTATAEAANRELAEALSRAAVNLHTDGAEARIDLEVALSQLPEEGEEGIDTPADLATQIATHGARVVHALAERQVATHSNLVANQSELRRIQAELDDQRGQHARANLELSSLRKELADVRMLQASDETKAENLRQEAFRLRQELTAQTRALADANAGLDREHQLVQSRNDDLALRLAEIESCKIRIANLEQQHALAQAEIAEFDARGGATADHTRDDMLALRKELARERESSKGRENELLALRERAEAAEARAKRLRDDFAKRLEERDLQVQDKDHQLDAIAERKTDLAGLQANVEELTRQLSAANAKIHALETASGASATITGRHNNIGAELKRTQADRDLLREQKRSLEADLSEANSLIDELKVQNEERSKEFSVIREQVQKALEGERSRSVALNDELGKVKADKIGLEHKLRKLTEGK
jgi:chromosome segregation ATPase